MYLHTVCEAGISPFVLLVLVRLICTPCARPKSLSHYRENTLAHGWASQGEPIAGSPQPFAVEPLRTPPDRPQPRRRGTNQSGHSLTEPLTTASPGRCPRFRAAPDSVIAAWITHASTDRAPLPDLTGHLLTRTAVLSGVRCVWRTPEEPSQPSSLRVPHPTTERDHTWQSVNSSENYW